MQRSILFSLDAIVFVLVLAAFEKTAYAYVDPGQGLLALQSLASAAAAAGYLFRRRLKALFRRSKAAETAE